MKLLAATDYSENSKSAIKFAIQLAIQDSSVELSFFHSFHIPQKSSLKEEDFEKVHQEYLPKEEEKLKAYIKNIYSELNQPLGYINYIAIESVVAHGNIINYAEKHGFDYICVGAHGAGTFEKFLGTNTINIINRSSIPVFAVPLSYQFEKIKHIIYAADFAKLTTELERIEKFSVNLDADIEVIHFSFPSETEEKIKQYESLPHSQRVSFHVIPNNALKPITTNIGNYVNEKHPSLLVMFTDQNKSFLEKLLFSGNTEGIALKTTVPLLVYSK